MWIFPSPSGLWTNQACLVHQQLVVGDTTFSVPRFSSYTHQVSNCHSNLVTTPVSSIDLTSKSVHYISLPFLCRIFLILDKLKIEMTKDSLQYAAKNGEHSCVENFHGDNLNPYNINKLTCTHQSPQETQHLAEIDLSHLKRETANHGSNLMEVD